MSNTFKQCPTYFSRGGAKIFLGGFQLPAPLPGYGRESYLQRLHFLCVLFWDSGKRDRRRRLIDLLGGFSLITRELQEVYSEMKYCQKDFRCIV